MKEIKTQSCSAGCLGKECSVLKKTINEQPILHWKAILVPTDLSEPSKQAIQTAVALAKLCGAKIVLLHVAQLPTCCSSDAPPNTDEMLNFANKSLDEIGRVFPPDIAWEKIVRLGTREPVREILEEASNISADVIVIGTHGYNGIKRFLLGNTAERVVRHALCPVLVARLTENVPEQTRQQAAESSNPFKKDSALASPFHKPSG
jgi:nucleotide-binding universal stress UspA family protein